MPSFEFQFVEEQLIDAEHCPLSSGIKWTATAAKHGNYHAPGNTMVKVQAAMISTSRLLGFITGYHESVYHTCCTMSFSSRRVCSSAGSGSRCSSDLWPQAQVQPMCACARQRSCVGLRNTKRGC